MSVTDIDDDDEKWLMHVRSQNAGQLGDALCKAARTGEVWRVETLLDMGVDINFRDGRVLLNAVSQSQHAVIDLLLARGITLTQAVLDDSLSEAAAKGDIKLVRDFLARGANAAHDDSVCLLNAIPRGDADVMRELLAAGANPRAGLGNYLCITIAHGHAEPALMMLQYGADPAVYHRDMNALDWAISLGMKSVADAIRSGGSGAVQKREFFEGMNVAALRAPQPLYGGQTGLHLAAKAGHFDIARDAFLSAGEKITTEELMQKTPAGQTVLLLLAQTQQLERVFDARLWRGRRDEAAALHAQHLPAAHRADVDIDSLLNAIDHLMLQETADSFRLAPKPARKPPRP